MTIHNNRDIGVFIPSQIDDLGLSIFAFRVYVRLIRLSGQGKSESIAEMAQSCGMGRTEITMSLSELSNFSLIELRGMNDITLLPFADKEAGQ
jgi:hypothetical protein